MQTKRLAAPVLFLLLICSSSCTDDIKWQNKFKGIWVLQSRVLPDGKEITPPAISGRMEWFPMDAEHAHLSFLTTYGPESVQVQGDHITLKGTTAYDRTTYMKIGGGLSPHSTEGVSTETLTTSGTIAGDRTRFTWTDDAGLTLTFDGDLLTIRHPDGTLDTLTQ